MNTNFPVIGFTKTKLPYGWLGNMSAHPVKFGGLSWRTAEAAFQAHRLPEGHIGRDLIRETPSPMNAKFIARRYHDDWIIPPESLDELLLMTDIVRAKFVQNKLVDPLLETSGNFLVEDVTSRKGKGRAKYWGAAKTESGNWDGQNVLGVILMNLRGEFSSDKKENLS